MTRLFVLLGMFPVLLASSTGDAAAQREGFVIGFGAGPGLTTGDVDSKVGVSLDLRVGALVSEFVQVYYTSKANFFSEEGALVSAGVHGLGITRQRVHLFARLFKPIQGILHLQYFAAS